MNAILQTERLTLRKFTKDDAAFIVSLLNTPGWLQFIGDRNINTGEQAITYLQNGPLKSYELNGYGLYLVELKNDKLPIGMCGIIKRDYLENPDIGFALLPEYMSKGFAFEIANATLKYAKEVLQQHRIFAITLPANTVSRRLLEKIGMSFIKPFYPPNTNDELMLFSN